MENSQLTLDEYEIVRTLGEGYSGVVKLAKLEGHTQFVALKIINKRLKNYQKVL